MKVLYIITSVLISINAFSLDLSSNDPQNITNKNFIAKHRETILLDNGYRIIQTFLYIDKEDLIKYGFYIINGRKVKIQNVKIQNNKIYFFYPFNSDLDPLEQGDRELYEFSKLSKSSF